MNQYIFSALQQAFLKVGTMPISNLFTLLSIKREWLNRFKILNYEQAYRLVFEYLEAFYNTKRIHSHCNYMSPVDFEILYERTNRQTEISVS